ILMRVPVLYRRLWPVAQRAMGASESILDDVDLTAEHTYTLRWESHGVAFALDGQSLLWAPTALAGPLTFTAWIDNSSAVATPRGRFGFGLVAEPETQWLEIAKIEIAGAHHPTHFF